MIYQFIDWRIGLHRRMCVVQVDSLFTRLRENNRGILPMYLSTWDDVLVFAGEAKIMLPENRAVAEAITVSPDYPTLDWLRGKYVELLKYVKVHNAALLVDPSFSPKPPVYVEEPRPSVPVVDPVAAAKEQLDKSVSNTEVREGSQCSEPSPPTTTRTLTSGDSPNVSLTKKNPFPPQRR